MATAVGFTIQLENHPGTLADLLEALGNAGVNSEGFGGNVCGDRGVAQLVADKPDRAEQALDRAGIAYTKDDVLLLNVANAPGAGAQVARAMANEGINVTSGSLTFGGRLVLHSDNRTKAEEVARRLSLG